MNLRARVGPGRVRCLGQRSASRLTTPSPASPGLCATGRFMRFVLALAVCCIILGCLLLNHWWVEDSLAELTHAAKTQLGLPEDADFHDVGIPIPRDTLFRLELDRVFLRLWFVFVPMTIAVCFGAAAVMPRF